MQALMDRSPVMGPEAIREMDCNTLATTMDDALVDVLRQRSGRLCSSTSARWSIKSVTDRVSRMPARRPSRANRGSGYVTIAAWA